MEPTVKQVVEAQAYQIQKAIINREINSGGSEYFADRKVFKKTDEEKGQLANLRAKWLKEMRAKFPDFTKRTGSKKKFLQTINNGENIEIN